MLWSFFAPAMAAVAAGAALTCVWLARGGGRRAEGSDAEADAPLFLSLLVSLRRYAAPTVPPHAAAITLAAWVTSASIIALVPVDIYSTLTRADPGALPALWAAAYWATQALTWCVIPLAQCASDAGDFTPLARLKTAAADCARFYGLVAAGAAAGVLALLAAGRLAWRQLVPLSMVLVNAYGLVAVVLLLGYGLVSIPRSLWRASFPDARLRACYAGVAASAERLAAAAAEARAVAAVVAATVAPVPRRDPLRPAADIVMAQAEATAPYKPSAAPRDAGGRPALDGLTDADLDYGADGLPGLAALRRRLIRSTGAYNGVRAQYVGAAREALALEAVAAARAAGDAARALAPGAAADPLARARAVYTVHAAPWVARVAAAVLAALSATVVWSEATIGTGAHPDLSPFSRALHAAGAATTPLRAHILAGAPLAYMAAAAYAALFSLGVFPFYRVVPRATEPRSLLANAGQVSRFAAPLAYNFLHVVRMVGGDGEAGRGGGGAAPSARADTPLPTPPRPDPPPQSQAPPAPSSPRRWRPPCGTCPCSAPRSTRGSPRSPRCTPPSSRPTRGARWGARSCRRGWRRGRGPGGGGGPGPAPRAPSAAARSSAARPPRSPRGRPWARGSRPSSTASSPKPPPPPRRPRGRRRSSAAEAGAPRSAAAGPAPPPRPRPRARLAASRACPRSRGHCCAARRPPRASARRCWVR